MATIFVKNLPKDTTESQLEALFGDIGPIRRSFIVKNKGLQGRSIGYITYALREDAQTALKEKLTIQSITLHTSLADPKCKKAHKNAADKPALETEKSDDAAQEPGQQIYHGNMKKFRLIVRNLSFKCKEKDLREAFSSYGELTDISIPKRANGLKCGFGFVQFGNLLAASNAVKNVNGKTILGRPVAVDFSVAKDRFVSGNQANQANSQQNAVKTNNKEASEKTGSDESSDDESSDDDVDSDDDEGSGDDSENEDESSDVESDDIDSGNDSDDSDSADDEESDEPSINNKQPKSKTVKSPKNKEDVSEGKTLFIRNLSYNTEEEDIQEFFERWGDISYCRLVMDTATDHSKGCAFLQFKSKESADQCLEDVQKPNTQQTLKIDGRQLFISKALTKEEIAKKKAEKKDSSHTDIKDKRNLWLAREGLVRSGTLAAQGMSKEEEDKRRKIALAKQTKLKNPNIFVSTTRLCIHNLPVKVTDKQLMHDIKRVMTSSKGVRITECRIMRDLQNVMSDGLGKSRGYAFVNFSKHEHALEALRTVNNNPDMYGTKKRPIVDFSLENRNALLAREKRQQRAKLKTATSDGKQQGKARKTQTITDKFGIGTRPEGVDKPKGMKAFPSHWGPKVRHRPRKTETQNKKKKRDVEKNKKSASKKTKTSMPTKRKRVNDDGFDKLVAKYRRTTDANAVKWFNT